MTTPSSVPTPPAQPEPTPEVVAAVQEVVAANRKERAKKFAKTLATRVGVPVAIGTAAAYVATRRMARTVEDQDTLELTASTEE